MQRSGTLAANEITVHRGAEAVLQAASLVVTPESRIGVVGPNGIGKSTLLQTLAGIVEPDSGTVTRRPPTLTVGYLPQERVARPEQTVLGHIARRTGVAAAEAEMDALAASLGDDPGLAQRYSDALERFLALGGEDLRARAAELCAGLGLAAKLEQPLETLSGGEAARAALAAILLARFDVFLLDEPTNDLDFEGLELLERFVGAHPGGVVIVSHDRAFLDRTVTRVVELEAGTRRIREWAGGWSEYEAARTRARERHYRDYERSEGERRRFEALQLQRREEARAGGKQANRRGTHALMSKARAAAKRLERVERVEKPWEPWGLQLELDPQERSGEVVATLERAVAVRGEFRLGPIDLSVAWGERVAIVGPNGSGKTTLLDALLGRVPLESGRRHIGPGVVLGELEQRRAMFAGEEPLLSEFCERSEMQGGDVRTLLAKFDLYSDHVLRAGVSLSPGERTRAALALQMARGVNCLVLDEPTNHLDVAAIEELEAALEDYPGTVLLVTHDRRLLESFRATRTVELPLRAAPRPPSPPI